MIKLKDLLNEVGMGLTSNKDEKTITIKHKTSEKEIVIVDKTKYSVWGVAQLAVASDC